jgi:hypothetical protein
MTGKRMHIGSAACWLLRIERSKDYSLQPETPAEWTEWAKEPANLAQFRRAARVWRILDLALAELGEFDADM